MVARSRPRRLSETSQAPSPAALMRQSVSISAGSVPPVRSLIDEALRLPPANGGAALHRGAGILSVALKTEHQGVAVDDAGAARDERACAAHLRLQLFETFC